jgi:zinc/manganese transport system ATP-binding protein
VTLMSVTPRALGRAPRPQVGPPALGAPIAQVRDAAVRMGSHTVWSGVSVTVRAGEFTAVLGPNGVGSPR